MHIRNTHIQLALITKQLIMLRTPTAYSDVSGDMPLTPYNRDVACACMLTCACTCNMQHATCTCVASTLFWQATRADTLPASNGARFTAGWILSRGHVPVIPQPLRDGCPPRINCELAAQIAPCWGGGCKKTRGLFLQSDLLVDLNRLDAALKQAVVMRCQHAGVLCPLSPPIPLWVDRPVNLSLGACNSGVKHTSRPLVPSHEISLKREHWFLFKLLGLNVSAAPCTSPPKN